MGTVGPAEAGPYVRRLQVGRSRPLRPKMTGRLKPAPTYEAAGRPQPAVTSEDDGPAEAGPT